MNQKKNKHINTTGFKTPESYFESFDEKLFSALHMKNHVIVPKKHGFKAPKNYFNTLDDKVIKKTHALSHKVRVIPVFKHKSVIYLSAIAAAILILFGISSTFNSTPSFKTLETQTVVNFIIDENITPYDIALLLDDDELSQALYVEQTIENSAIEAYLLNNSDLETLIFD